MTTFVPPKASCARVRACIAAAFLCCASSASAQTLSGAWNHSLIATPDGTVLAFGDNSRGQLGDGSVADRSTPITIPGLADVVAVAAGQEHSLALTSGGQVWAWGSHLTGQLGRHFEWEELAFDCYPCRPAPVLLDLTSVVAIAAGSGHSLALLSNGDVYGWGDNHAGAYAGVEPWSDVPVLVMSEAIGISAGPSRSMVLKSDGTVWGTGWNQEGALGDGTYTNRSSFVQMSGITGAVEVETGGGHTVVLLRDGTLKAVGYNGSGNLGDGTWVSHNVPVEVSGMSGAVGIAVGSAHSYALKVDGTVWAWGNNDYGQLGDGTNLTRSLPEQVNGLASILEIASGFVHGMALDANGVVWMWGMNAEYQLGDGSTTNRLLPEPSSGPNYAWRVAKPRFDPPGGYFDTQRAVIVTVDTPGATIHYTRNGQEPTQADPIVVPGGTVWSMPHRR